MNQGERTDKSWLPEAAAGVLVVTSVALFFALRSPLKSAPDIVLFLGRFHPLAVHLPIGILLLVAFAEALTVSAALRKLIDPAIPFILPALVVSAVGSFALGQLLASGGGFPAKLVGLHRTLTFLSVIMMAGCYVVFRQGAPSGAAAGWRWGYRGMLVATVGMLSIGAHYGGSITRGEGYLARYAPGPLRSLLGGEEAKTSTNDEVEPSSDPLVFNDVIMPVLKQRCVECHGSETTKGGLRVDSMAALLKGGDDGPAIIAGQGTKSPLIARMLLPMTDEDRMPPEGKPGPTDEEIQLIRWWIDRGASETLRVRDVLPPPSSREVLERSVATGASSSSPATTRASSSAPASASASAEPATPATSASTQPGASSTPAVTTGAVAADASVWSTRVAPILQSRCGRCHGDAKQKGKLRVDSLASLLSGGKTGAALVPGSPERGTLLARVHLPMSDDKHMPPSDEPQMTAAEIALVTWWIEKGGSADTKIAALPADLQKVFASAVRPPPPPVAVTTTEPTATAPTTSVSTATPPVQLPDLASLPPEVNLYKHIAQPILSDRCSTCHGSVGPMGDLNVEELEPLLKGGESGAAVVPGDPKRSPLIKRMKLPLKNADHMPPPDMSQPKRGEIAALELWIKEGAKGDTMVKPADLSPEILLVLAETLPKVKPDATAPGPTPIPSASASASTSAVPPSPLPSASATASASPNKQVSEHAPPQTTPGGGCASCTVGTRDDAGTGCLGALVIAALGWRRARRLSSAVVRTKSDR